MNSVKYVCLRYDAMRLCSIYLSWRFNKTHWPGDLQIQCNATPGLSESIFLQTWTCTRNPDKKVPDNSAKNASKTEDIATESSSIASSHGNNVPNGLPNRR